MNKQEIFDKVAAHLIAQGKRAINPTGDCCQYRTPDGLKCAAGCLISDEAYRPVYEGRICSDPAIAMALKQSGVDVEDRETLDLVYRLQSLHDDMKLDPADWKAALRGFAHAHGHLYCKFGE